MQPARDSLSNIDLRSGESSLKIADVLEGSNLSSGYTIGLSSENAGKLTHSDGLSSIEYQIKYGASGDFVSPSSIGTSTLLKSSGPLSGMTAHTEEVFINIPPNSNLKGGTYTDTLIFSIKAI